MFRFLHQLKSLNFVCRPFFAEQAAYGGFISGSMEAVRLNFQSKCAAKTKKLKEAKKKMVIYFLVVHH